MTERGLICIQQSTRLQRRCYWLLESEDDIVLVHYLNIDKAKGKTEDTWAASDCDMSRRAGFTVTSGGIHNIQVSRCNSEHLLMLCESVGLLDEGCLCRRLACFDNILPLPIFRFSVHKACGDGESAFF